MNKQGEREEGLDFVSYVRGLHHACTLNWEELAAFTFALFDSEGERTVTCERLVEVVQQVHGGELDASVTEAIGVVAAQYGGTWGFSTSDGWRSRRSRG